MDGKEFSALVGTAMYLREKHGDSKNFNFTTEVNGVKAKFHNYDNSKISIRLKGYSEVSDDDLTLVEYGEEDVKQVLENVDECDNIEEEIIKGKDGENRVNDINQEKYKDSKVKETLGQIGTKNLILVVDGELKLDLKKESVTDICAGENSFLLDGEGEILEGSNLPLKPKIIGDVTVPGQAESGEKSFENDLRLLKKYIRLEATGDKIELIPKGSFKNKFADYENEKKLSSQNQVEFIEKLKKELEGKFKEGNSTIEVGGMELTVHILDEKESDEGGSGDVAIDGYFEKNIDDLYKLYESVKKKVKFKIEEGEKKVKFLKGFNDLFESKALNIEIDKNNKINRDNLQYFRKKFKESMGKSYKDEGKVFGQEVEIKKDEVANIITEIGSQKELKGNKFVLAMIKNSKTLCKLIKGETSAPKAIEKIKGQVKKDFGSEEDPESLIGKFKEIKEKYGKLGDSLKGDKNFVKAYNLLDKIEEKIKCLL